MSAQPRGPSPTLIAWRRFIIETVLCLVLIAVIVALGFHARHDPWAGAAIGALVAIVLRILWRHA